MFVYSPVLLVTAWYFHLLAPFNCRQWYFRTPRAGWAKLGQVKPGQVKPGQARPGQARLDQARQSQA